MLKDILIIGLIASPFLYLMFLDVPIKYKKEPNRAERRKKR